MATTTRSTTTRKPATKRRTRSSATTPKSATPAAAKIKSTQSSKSKTNPYVKAAVATGAVAAAAVGAAYFIRKSDKSVGEIADGLKSTVKGGLAEATAVARDSARSIKKKASGLFDSASTELDIVAKEVGDDLTKARDMVIGD